MPMKIQNGIHRASDKKAVQMIEAKMNRPIEGSEMPTRMVSRSPITNQIKHLAVLKKGVSVIGLVNFRVETFVAGDSVHWGGSWRSTLLSRHSFEEEVHTIDK